MTYGTTDGSTIAPPPPPPPVKPVAYGGGTKVPPGQGTVPPPDTTNWPPVPSGSGSGKGTSVHTPSMDLFAENINSLIAPVQAASTKLSPIGVQPGAFYHANKIRGSVNGPNQDDGLKEAYIKVLADLASGLADLREGVKTLSAKYKSTEDANNMTATDLKNAMDSSQSQFGKTITDNGGSAPPPPAPPATGSGSGS